MELVDNVKKFTKDKAIEFPVEKELCIRIYDLMHEYPELSLIAALGILDIVKDKLKED